ncbi:MAG: hypothetical protein K8I01_08160 [Candidatus Methylomirabilis sp.]|nr:hypothetical protein [Deltaproteobacteria bacterium]
MAIDINWFLMTDIKKRSLIKASWTPLCAYDEHTINGEPGHIGYEREYFGSVGLIFPIDQAREAFLLQWDEVIPKWGHKPCVENGKYFPADVYSFCNGLLGTYPVLQQSFDSGEPCVWHLSQDIILGLGLLRERDGWVRPQEDYLEVARLKRIQEGKPVRFEIRTEHLRDFLCARESGILIVTYHLREIIVDSAPDFGWKNGIANETGENYHWNGHIHPIHEGGFPFGEKIAVFHMGRTNIDPNDDIPTFGMPGEDEYKSSSWVRTPTGRQLFSITGEMWRTEWIPPLETSPRVRGDKEESHISFQIDSAGTTLAGKKLYDHRGWIWFKPSIIRTLLEKRNGVLEWYTDETGCVGPAPNMGVHFGVNELGLINVLAKDIASLPTIYQRVWVAHNIPPDGRVSKELLKSQMEAEPADTKAPEVILKKAIEHLQKASTYFLGRPMLKEHHISTKIDREIHRFHGQSMEGLFFLCKELTRLIVERIDVDLLKELDPAADKKLGSIKRLEYFLNSKGFEGRKIMAALAGVYDLRIGDSHLPSTEITESLKLLGIGDTGDYQKMAKQIILSVAYSIGTIGDIIIKSSKDNRA